jgi:hypothetical protein
MKHSRQSLQEIDDPREHRNLASRTRSLGRIILAGVAASRYRDDAALQIDVIPSQRSGFAMSHAAPKQKEEPWAPVRVILHEPRHDRVSLIGVKGVGSALLLFLRSSWRLSFQQFKEHIWR